MLTNKEVKEHEGQVKRLARRLYSQYRDSLGASLGADDLEQELWIVFAKVCESFDPERGVKLTTLFWTAARNRTLQLASFQARRRSISAVSLNSQVDPGGRATELVEGVAAVALTVEQEIINRQGAEHLLNKMDPRLRKMVEILTDMPDWAEEELRGMQAQADLAAKLGVKANLPKRITLTMLTELFGLSRCSRYRLLDEMKELVDA